jgi:hypothetical protein
VSCLQAQQALVAAQQAAAIAPPKQVDGWVPTRVISDLFVGGRNPVSPTGTPDGLQDSWTAAADCRTLAKCLFVVFCLATAGTANGMQDKCQQLNDSWDAREIAAEQ